AQSDGMHRAEDVMPTGREHACHLLDDARRVGHEDERVVVVDQIEGARGERAEVAHVALDETKPRPALAREGPDGSELTLRKIEQRGLGAELGEEDRIPAATTGQ